MSTPGEELLERVRNQKDLWSSVEQTRRGESARVTKVQISAAAQARASAILSQQELASLLGVSARMLQGWERGRHQSTSAANTLLRVAVSHPEVQRQLLR